MQGNVVISHTVSKNYIQLTNTISWLKELLNHKRGGKIAVNVKLHGVYSKDFDDLLTDAYIEKNGLEPYIEAIRENLAESTSSPWNRDISCISAVREIYFESERDYLWTYIKNYDGINHLTIADIDDAIAKVKNNTLTSWDDIDNLPTVSEKLKQLTKYRDNEELVHEALTKWVNVSDCEFFGASGGWFAIASSDRYEDSLYALEQELAKPIIDYSVLEDDCVTIREIECMLGLIADMKQRVKQAQNYFIDYLDSYLLEEILPQVKGAVDATLTVSTQAVESISLLKDNNNNIIAAGTRETLDKLAKQHGLTVIEVKLLK